LQPNINSDFEINKSSLHFEKLPHKIVGKIKGRRSNLM